MCVYIHSPQKVVIADGTKNCDRIKLNKINVKLSFTIKTTNESLTLKPSVKKNIFVEIIQKTEAIKTDSM